jgi:serine protease
MKALCYFVWSFRGDFIASMEPPGDRVKSGLQRKKTSRPMSYQKRRILYILFGLWVITINVYASAETKNYIVVFKDHPQKHSMAKEPEFAAARSFHIIPAITARLDSQQLDTLRKNSRIAYIEPDYPIYATGLARIRGDSAAIVNNLASQEIPYGVEMIGAAQVWSKTKGAGAVVAVLDTGIAMYHPDKGNVIASASFVTDLTVEDFNSHGTHTAGTIAAADNTIGVVGVAPEAGLLIGKVLNNAGEGEISGLIAGIEWAVENGAHVISMSLGGTRNSAALETACDNAYAQGVLLVAAAGNDNTSVPEYPAAYASVLSVAAVDINKEKADFSNYGSTIDVAAPGVDVLSTIPVGFEAIGDAIWSAASHSSNILQGTSAGIVTGQICNCGLATGLDTDNTCPDTVAGNIAHIRRGTITFAEKVAHAQAKGAVGVIISNNVSGNFLGTLSAGSPLVAVSISMEDGDQLQPLAESGIAGTVSVTADLVDYFSGTSMATPHVSGAAALIVAAQGANISPSEVWDLLINSAEDLGDPGRDDLFGYGLIHVNSAFESMPPKTCDAVWTLEYGYPSDINRDCYLDLNDLTELAAEWLNQNCSDLNEWCSRSDIDQNTSVSCSDFAELASVWLACNNPQDLNCTPNWP